MRHTDLVRCCFSKKVGEALCPSLRGPLMWHGHRCLCRPSAIGTAIGLCVSCNEHCELQHKHHFVPSRIKLSGHRCASVVAVLGAVALAATDAACRVAAVSFLEA